jgi:multiple sugar transport system permease protein
MVQPRARRWLPGLGKPSPIRPRYLPALLVLPAFIVLLAITIFPLVYTATLTLFSWELTTKAPAQFVALGNFARVLFGDGRFWNAMRNTTVLVVFGVGLQVILGTGLALLINRLRRVRTLTVSLILIPVMIAPVVAGFQFRMIYNDQYGPLNHIIEVLTGGLWGGTAWLAEPSVALISILIADVWQWTPFMILIVLAGLQAIPEELHEAARVDGASAPQHVWHITLPLVMPVIVVGILVRMMDTFKLFDIVYQLTAGGPGSTTETVAYYTYLQGFKFFSLGYTAAMAVIQLIVITIVAKFFLGYQKRMQQRGSL